MRKSLQFFVLLFGFSAQVNAGDILQASVVQGPSPLSTILTWECPPTATSANAISVGNQVAWTGTKPTKGKQSLSGIRANNVYTIECLVPAETSVTLTWTMPTEYTDGIKAYDVAGTRLYWGTKSGEWPETLQINSASVTSQKLDLKAGTYYFVAKWFTRSGVESDVSNEISRTLASGGKVTDQVSITVEKTLKAGTLSFK